MSDRRIDQLTEKPTLVPTDLIVVAESSGTTWKSTVEKFRDSLFGLVDLIVGTPDKNDSVFLRRFQDGKIRRVPVGKLIPDQTITNSMLADGSDLQGTGISSSKLAPSAVTNSKLAVDAVHTHNIHDAEPANIDNYPPRIFGTGVTTEKIVDGAVTGIKGGVPSGAVFYFAGRTAPAGYLICNGDIISDNYEQITQGVNNWRLQDLRLILGTTYGVQGQLPDLRGVFLRGYSGTEGNIGVGKNAVYKHFIRSGVGPKTALQIRTEAESVGTNANSYSYFVIEWMSVATISSNPGQGPWNPRAGVPVNVVAWGKGTTPNISLTENARYKIYEMRYTTTAAFGKPQEHRYMAHTHAISEAIHDHGIRVPLNANAWSHNHDRVEIGIAKGGAGKDSWLTGGSQALKPSQGDVKFYDDISAARWSGQPAIANAASPELDENFTYATCEHSFSYGYPHIFGSQTPVYSQPVNASTVSSDPADETRPSNIALLPCIKY